MTALLMDAGSRGGIYFSTDLLPARDRFPAVREEFARRLLTIECVDRSARQFSATFNIQPVGGIAIGRIDTAAADYVRTPELIRDGQEYLFVTLPLRGAIVCSQPSSCRSYQPGQAVILDSTHVGGIHLKTDASYLTIRIARSGIARGFPLDVEFAGLALDRDPLAVPLLTAYLGATRDFDLSGGGTVAALFEEHIFDLVLLALGAQGEAANVAAERGGRAARRAAILREIDRHSGHQPLSAAGIAVKLGITPRYVHALLEETGQSFTHHVLERRLERSAALLREHGAQMRRIADIAAEAGFGDLSHFNRAFRRRYGMSPSDVRDAAFRERANGAPGGKKQ